MNIRILIFSLLLSSCGSGDDQTSTEFNIPNSQILYQGEIKGRPELLEVFNDVNICMFENFDISPQREDPILVLTSHGANCGQGLPSAGCYSFVTNTIYLKENTKYPGMEYLIFGHEVIHWLTQKGNELHNGLIIILRYACSHTGYKFYS